MRVRMQMRGCYKNIHKQQKKTLLGKEFQNAGVCTVFNSDIRQS